MPKYTARCPTAIIQSIHPGRVFIMKQVHAVSLNVACLNVDASHLGHTGGLLGKILFSLSGGGYSGELEQVQDTLTLVRSTQVDNCFLCWVSGWVSFCDTVKPAVKSWVVTYDITVLCWIQTLRPSASVWYPVPVSPISSEKCWRSNFSQSIWTFACDSELICFFAEILDISSFKYSYLRTRWNTGRIFLTVLHLFLMLVNTSH